MREEQWFLETFGVNRLFTPDNSVCSAKGAVVINIAHIPLALTKVMELNGVSPDFAPTGTLSLKPWLVNNQGLSLPPELDLPTVEAVPPYNEQIRIFESGFESAVFTIFLYGRIIGAAVEIDEHINPAAATWTPECPLPDAPS